MHSLRGIAYGEGTFVAVGFAGVIIQSDPLNGGTPQILQHPRGGNRYVGDSVTLQVSAVGASPLLYQWLRDGNPVSGATNPSLVLVNLRATDAGTYSVIVSNAFASVTSQAATLVVQQGQLPDLAIHSYAGLTISGIVGHAYRIEYTNSLQATNNWQTLTNLLLPESPHVWIDLQSAGTAKRFYRAALLP